MHREAMTFFSSEPIVNLILLSVVSKPLQRALIAACTEYADRSHPLGAAVSSHSCIGCCHVAPPPRCKDQYCALDPQLMPSLAHSECNATAPGHQPVYCSVQVLGLP